MSHPIEADASCAYGGDSLKERRDSMLRKRYRITVTPIESDGRPCDDRCTIEFEQRSRADWMRLLEELHLRRDLSSDECAALTVGSQLLEDLAARPRAQPSDALDALRPKLQLLLDRLQRVQPTPRT